MLVRAQNEGTMDLTIGNEGVSNPTKSWDVHLRHQGPSQPNGATWGDRNHIEPHTPVGRRVWPDTPRGTAQAHARPKTMQSTNRRGLVRTFTHN